MTWLQIFVLLGVMATFMGAGIALAAYFNGKHIKKGVTEIKNFLAETNKSFELRHREVIDWFKKSDAKSAQQHNDVVELLKKGFGN